MKTIKIFLASSEELKQDRLEIADLVENLNIKLNKIDFNIQLVKWEYLDSSMGIKHKQEEYNDKLKTCELCIVLYWTKFGMYTKQELDTAYNRLCAGDNPKKLYVYFKDSAELTDELRVFRDSFPQQYGHFYCSYSNVDTLKADFLLQFMEYQSTAIANTGIVEVKNGKVIINGKEYVSLQNVPFAGNNEEYNLLLKNIKKTQKLLAITDEDDPDYSDYASELQELEEKLSKMESSLWDTALMITRLSTTKCSERLKRAMDLFTRGDNKGAQAILNENEIEKDVEHNLNLIKLGEEGRKGIATNIEEYRLKIKTIENEMEERWYSKVDELYKKCIKLGKDILEKEDYASLLSDYGDFLKGESEYEKIEEIYKESLSILYELEQKQKGSCDKLICWNLRNLSEYYINSNQYTLAEKVLTELLEFLKDTDDSARKADALYHLAYLHSMMLKYELAEEELKKAIALAEGSGSELNKDVLTHCLYQLGLLYKNTNRLTEAEDYANKTIKIYLTDCPDIKDSFAARVYQLLGNIYSLEGKNPTSIQMHKKSEEINRELMKRDPNAYRISLVCDLGNLSAIHAQIGDYDTAIQELKEALENITTLFEKYPLQYSEFYAHVVQDLAHLLKNTKKYKEATDLLKKSLEAYEILKNTDAERHLFQLAHALNLQGCIFLENREYQQAREALCSALKLRKELSQQYGEKHLTDVAQTLTNIALLNCDTYNFEESEKQYFEIIEIYELLTEKHEQNHEIDTALVYLNIAWLFLKQKEYDKAIQYGIISVNTFKSTPDSKIKDKFESLSLEAQALHNLSVAYFNKGLRDDAYITISESIKITKELSQANPNVYAIQLATDYNKLGYFKYKQGEFNTAEEIAQESYNITINYDIKPSIMMSLDTLACIHRELGKYEIAENEFLKCIAFCQELLPIDNQYYNGKLAHEYIELTKLYYSCGDLKKYTISIENSIKHMDFLDDNHKFDFQDDINELNKIQNIKNSQP